MKFLLDTMTWFWLCQNPENMSEAVVKTLMADSSKWGLSVASIWEITRKVRLKTEKPRHSSALELGVPINEWLSRALDQDDYHVLPITREIAVEANALPGEFHNDPMDQLIVATARIHNLTIVTSDTLIKGYPHVRSLYFKGPPGR